MFFFFDFRFLSQIFFDLPHLFAFFWCCLFFLVFIGPNTQTLILAKVELAKIELAKVELAELELAKVDQIKMAKVELAKVDRSRFSWGVLTQQTQHVHEPLEESFHYME